MITNYRFTVFASELQRSRLFYENRMGCLLSEITDVGFTATRDDLVIIVEGGAKPRKLGKRWLGEAGLYITLKVDDFDAMFADLTKRGVPFLDDVALSAEGKRVTGFADPDGVLYELREA